MESSARAHSLKRSTTKLYFLVTRQGTGGGGAPGNRVAIAVLLTPKPPALMVLNEPETSLHPDLFPALGRLIGKASERGQVWVVTHSPLIREMRPAWSWPRR